MVKRGIFRPIFLIFLIPHAANPNLASNFDRSIIHNFKASILLCNICVKTSISEFVTFGGGGSHIFAIGAYKPLQIAHSPLAIR